MIRAMRSWLFVPGDSERKLGKAEGTGADVVIIDLEDAVAPEAKPRARAMAGEWLRSRHPDESHGPAPWVRINPLDTDLWRDDLAAVLPGAPAGIMLPKAAGPAEVEMLADHLTKLEAETGIAPGTTRIVPLVSETPAAALAIAAYADAPSPRLAGLAWGAEDLSAAIGAARKRRADGEWTDAFRMVRAATLLAAHASAVTAIDTLFDDFRDEAGLARVASAAAADGFGGMLAIHPAQVPIINAAFTPGEAALAEARVIIDLFAANPGAGALQLDGRMIDRPHLELARRLIARAQT